MHAREAGEDSHSGDDGAKHGVLRNRLGNKQRIGQTQSAFLFCSSRCLGAGWGGRGLSQVRAASGDELPAIDARDDILIFLG